MFELNRLYNMDCMKAMQEIPDKFFELAICDPPYGIGFVGFEINKNYFEKANERIKAEQAQMSIFDFM